MAKKRKAKKRKAKKKTRRVASKKKRVTPKTKRKRVKRYKAVAANENIASAKPYEPDLLKDEDATSG